MKIKITKSSYEKVCALKPKKRKKPLKPNSFFRFLLKTVSSFDLKDVNFKYDLIGMENLKDDEPCLILMNHSSFLDLEMTSKIFAKRPVNIICTEDGFVGKNWLLRHIGCVPTKKFTMDIALVQDLKYCVDKLKSSILLFPEASYTFDGTATPLPEMMGKLAKFLKVPIVSVTSHGSFLRQPLYNYLNKRKIDASATVKFLLSKEDIKSKSIDQINEIILNEFKFDNFKEQQENNILIKEENRALGLNKPLYKCPHCLKEGHMHSEGIYLECPECHTKYELTENGFLKNVNGETIFDSVPKWYQFERESVKKEIENRSYFVKLPVKILMMIDNHAVYEIGEGELQHSNKGFELNGCNNKLHFSLKPEETYCVYSDFYWYSIGDMVAIGNSSVQYYCFPKEDIDIVAKIRLAVEELYKFNKKS